MYFGFYQLPDYHKTHHTYTQLKLVNKFDNLNSIKQKEISLFPMLRTYHHHVLVSLVQIQIRTVLKDTVPGHKY